VNGCTWRDLFEGYRANEERFQFSKEQFELASHGLTGNSSPRIPTDWFTTDIENIVARKELQERVGQNSSNLLSIFWALFHAPKCFFMTRSSALYGIAPCSVQKGDRLVFLVPPVYMAFILRPDGDTYQMLGACFIPPRARKRYMNRQSAAGRFDYDSSEPLDRFIIN
jgi:hypothetical protein